VRTTRRNRSTGSTTAPGAVVHHLRLDERFADLRGHDNDRIMRLSFSDLNIYYLVANAGGARFSRESTVGNGASRPRAVDYNPITGRSSSSKRVSIRVACYMSMLLGKSRSLRVRIAWVLWRRRPCDRRRLNDPRAVAVDSRGNAYIADYGNHAIRMVVGGALP